ncbi:hypothetical protein ACIOHE_15575 [Streptomyces sp. NPDC087851]|uniref:hypothetical protein n=1 Tax=Streptomyces sp. NPDC087851 TaxID=3365810 RepID=UPI0037F92B87
MSWTPPPIIPIEIPEPPATPSQPLPPVGSTVTYVLSAQDLDIIAAQDQPEDAPYPPFAKGETYTGVVTERGSGDQLTLRVLLVPDATITMWALLRPEGTTPGTWARPAN